MQNVESFFAENYQWLFGGIGVPVVVYLFRFLVKRNRPNRTENSIYSSNLASSSNIVNNTTNVQVSYGHVPELAASAAEKGPSQTRARGRQKDGISILFIDDQHADFPIVKFLRDSGYKNVSAMKDLNKLDDRKVELADVIFVDINGVGQKLSKDEGKGLARALKSTYPKKKIVLYSSETQGDIFDKTLDEVDYRLPKNADAIQWIDCLETLSRDIE